MKFPVLSPFSITTGKDENFDDSLIGEICLFRPKKRADRTRYRREKRIQKHLATTLYDRRFKASETLYKSLMNPDTSIREATTKTLVSVGLSPHSYMYFTQHVEDIMRRFGSRRFFCEKLGQDLDEAHEIIKKRRLLWVVFGLICLVCFIINIFTSRIDNEILQISIQAASLTFAMGFFVVVVAPKTMSYSTRLFTLIGDNKPNMDDFTTAEEVMEENS